MTDYRTTLVNRREHDMKLFKCNDSARVFGRLRVLKFILPADISVTGLYVDVGPKQRLLSR